MSTLTLATPRVLDTIERLHRAARGDWKHLVRVAPRYILSRISGRDFMQRSPSVIRHTYSSVTREEGQFLYLLARAIGARRIVEFGCSFGISTLYLAAAARDNGGIVLTTEIEPAKAQVARENLHCAGLADLVTVLEGDALDTLRSAEGEIDLLFLDGMKPLYLPVLELVRPRLRAGSVMVGDNVDMPSARPYTEHVRDFGRGFVSSALFGGRMEVSFCAG